MNKTPISPTSKWCDNQSVDEMGKVICLAHLAEARVPDCPYKSETMKGLFRKRGGGKTTALVYTSAITGYPIVVPTTISKRYVKDVARRVGVSIPEPIVMSEDARGRRIGGVLIDNAEEIIRAYAAEHFNAPVIAYTITVDGDGDSA